jgi:hypothetical protein
MNHGNDENNCTGWNRSWRTCCSIPPRCLPRFSACCGVRALPRELRSCGDHGLLDTWEAPEPSPYFLTRLDARMREEREAAPAGWLARLRAGLPTGRDACSSAGGHGADRDAAGGRRNLSGRHQLGPAGRSAGAGCRGARSADAGQQRPTAGSVGSALQAPPGACRDAGAPVASGPDANQSFRRAAGPRCRRSARR